MSLLPLVVLLSIGQFPEPPDTEAALPDGSLAQPMPAEEAAAKFTVPEGFRVNVFAAEPDVRNPIAASYDGKGRLWVAENFTYANRQDRFNLSLRDRVVVLEDTDQDGRADRRTVFTDRVQMLTSVCPGPGPASKTSSEPLPSGRGADDAAKRPNADEETTPIAPPADAGGSPAGEDRKFARGVWLMCPPRLLFVPDGNMDLVPDGEPEVVLDGFTVAEANYHNFANGLKWGPDGWLYGRCGGSCPGRIGKPGTPDEQRVALEGGIWRYSLEQDRVEVLCHGTCNPWGHDWNAEGELFFCNTVNGHLWHMIPGAHYTRPFTLDPNSRTYELIDFHADHWHFPTGMKWNESRAGAADAHGGGHAHCGVMIYQGGAWPQWWDGKLLTLNFHGRRVNVESIHKEGSGYVLKHEVDPATGTDPFIAADPFFRGMDIIATPDGQALILDWSDTGECHDHTGVHRSSGRIYRVAYESGRLAAGDDGRGVDVTTLDEDALRTGERSSNGWLRNAAHLERRYRPNSNPDHIESDFSRGERRRADQILSGGARGLPVPERIAALRYANRRRPIDDCFGPVAPDASGHTPHSDAIDHENLLEYSPHPRVRLELASTLQRLPIDRRAELAAALVVHPGDTGDHNLPLLVWYGLMPCEAGDLASVANASTWPTTTRLIVRRLSELIEDEPAALDAVLMHAANLQVDPSGEPPASAGDAGGVDVGSDIEQTATSDAPAADGTGSPAERRQELLLAVLNGLDQGLRGVSSAPKPRSWDAFAAAVRATNNADAINTLDQLEAVFGGGRSLEELRRSILDDRADIAVRRSALESLVRVKAHGVGDIAAELLDDARINVVAAEGVALSSDAKHGRRLAEAYRRFRAPERPRVVSILASRPAFAVSLLNAVEDGSIPLDAVAATDVRMLRSLPGDDLAERVATLWGANRETPAQRLQAIADLKERLTTDTSSPDLAAGRRQFVTSCGACHKMYGEGGDFGPELTGSDRTNLDYLLVNILDPSAIVSKDYRRSVIVTTDGRVLDGVVTREDDRTLTLRNDKGETTVPLSDIDERQQTDQSPMPEGLLDRLSEGQVRDLFAYLRHPVPVE